MEKFYKRLPRWSFSLDVGGVEMIGNVLASTTIEADIWSHFISFEHALERAIKTSRVDELHELDKDRIHAFIGVLGFLSKGEETFGYVNSCMYVLLDLEINIFEVCQSTSRFVCWMEQNQIEESAEEGLNALMQCVNNSLKVLPTGLFSANTLRDECLVLPGLFPENTPHEELVVLLDVVRRVMTEIHVIG